jgi:hypothetical protein
VHYSQQNIPILHIQGELQTIIPKAANKAAKQTVPKGKSWDCRFKSIVTSTLTIVILQQFALKHSLVNKIDG